MVVGKSKDQAGRGDGQASGKPLARRVFLWSIMAATIAWTLVYQMSRKDSELPEFVYVNF